MSTFSGLGLKTAQWSTRGDYLHSRRNWCGITATVSCRKFRPFVQHDAGAARIRRNLGIIQFLVDTRDGAWVAYRIHVAKYPATNHVAGLDEGKTSVSLGARCPIDRIGPPDARTPFRIGAVARPEPEELFQNCGSSLAKVTLSPLVKLPRQ